jgi:hypothetical protein
MEKGGFGDNPPSLQFCNLDESAKSRKFHCVVIPAQAEIQSSHGILDAGWRPA